MSMIQNPSELTRWIEKIAVLIEQQDDLEIDCDISFVLKPELALYLIELFNNLDEKEIEKRESYYSACLFVLEACLSQLEFACEQKNKLAQKSLLQLMLHIANFINAAEHSLNFWIPLLNAFYDAQIELIPELKSAYLNLAAQEEDLEIENEFEHLEAIREIILESSDLSNFDIAETFFAQSHAMTPDFFAGLMLDLFSIEEGQDIALLILLHPQRAVRDIAVFTLNQLIDKVTLSSISLSRLQAIKNWYPKDYHPQFEYWLKTQRKKGVVFSKPSDINPVIKIKASEIDGEGTQGIFIRIKKNKKNYIAALILKYDVGIKDMWLSAQRTERDAIKNYANVIQENVTVREVDISYFIFFVRHFLAVMGDQGRMPNLHLLELQEHLGIQLQPAMIDIPFIIGELSAQIVPFTPEVMQQAFKRSKRWTKEKAFTEFWYVMNPKIDKLVNQFCSFVNGIKICNISEAMESVFKYEFECQREKWLFHFLWVALWGKNKARAHEKMADDSVILAYAISTDIPLKDIPLMQEICYQTVVNSIETMNERRTYLARGR